MKNQTIESKNKCQGQRLTMSELCQIIGGISFGNKPNPPGPEDEPILDI
jgi:hypothetical protein